MSTQGPKTFQEAVKYLSRLPGVGQRTAQRFVLHLMKQPTDEVLSMVQALMTMKETLRECERCFAYSDHAVCIVCSDSQRDTSLICVLEEASDVFAVERSGQFKGVYHVLHGRLAPLDGVGPSDLRIGPLLQRVKTQEVKEVLLATNPDVEGEATALYVAKLLKDHGVAATRIATGIPMGGHLEYLDQLTLGKAITERRAFSS